MNFWHFPFFAIIFNLLPFLTWHTAAFPSCSQRMQIPVRLFTSLKSIRMRKSVLVARKLQKYAQLRGGAENLGTESSIVESAHLKLQKVQTTASSTATTTASDTSELSSVEGVKWDMIIYEAYNTTTNETLAACFTDFDALNIFFHHLYGEYLPSHSNVSLYRDVGVREQGVMCNDTAAYRHYFSMWQRGIFLGRRKHFQVDWNSFDPLKSIDQSYLDMKPPIDTIILPNMRRMQLLWRESAKIQQLYQFLQDYITHENATIWGRNLSDYHYKPPQLQSTDESLQIIRDFSRWFRAVFPYYYSQCLHCGFVKPDSSSSNETENSFLGIVHANATEQQGAAVRTELIHCGRCGSVSRFARYNDVIHMLSSRFGRCGEYSVLMMQMLRGLGYENVRWIVDRDDHLWCEVGFPAQSNHKNIDSGETNGDGIEWYHVDPCEACVNEPFIYESWGKKPAFVFAMTQSSVVDVTKTYSRNDSQILAIRAAENITEEYVHSLILQANSYAQEYAYNLTLPKQ